MRTPPSSVSSTSLGPSSPRCVCVLLCASGLLRTPALALLPVRALLDCCARALLKYFAVCAPQHVAHPLTRPLFPRRPSARTPCGQVIAAICVLVWVVNLPHFKDPLHGEKPARWIVRACVLVRVLTPAANPPPPLPHPPPPRRLVPGRPLTGLHPLLTLQPLLPTPHPTQAAGSRARCTTSRLRWRWLWPPFPRASPRW